MIAHIYWSVGGKAKVEILFILSLSAASFFNDGHDIVCEDQIRAGLECFAF